MRDLYRIHHLTSVTLLKVATGLLILFFLGLAVPLPGSADTVEMVIGPLDKSAQPGRQIDVPLYFHNTGSSHLHMEPAQHLTFRLSTKDQSTEVVAQKMGAGDPSKQVIEINGFIKLHYALTIPENIEGMVYLSASDFQQSGRYLSITKPPTEDTDRFAWIPRSTDQPLDSLIQLYQPYVKNLSHYKPMYFLVGVDPEDSKFQLSLKYRFFSRDKALVKENPWLEGFHFGYTQTSFWDLASDSAPFEDTSYKPELFYSSQRIKSRWPLLDGHYIKTGFRHESNGRGGELSRSTNTIYIEPTFIFYNEQRRTGLRITPRLWTYVYNEDESNPDLDEYRGYFNLGVAFGKAGGLAVDTNFQWAQQGASVQVDLTYPLHTLFFSHLDMYIQAQYVNQLAESLINYTDRTEALRIGIAIVR